MTYVSWWCGHCLAILITFEIDPRCPNCGQEMDKLKEAK
jgi:Zn finger protein HypA/HybF involved in hydrogenase expression